METWNILSFNLFEDVKYKEDLGFIDKDHTIILKEVEYLKTAISIIDIESLLKKILQEINNHFDREESFFYNAKFEYIEDHRKRHNAFRDELTSYFQTIGELKEKSLMSTTDGKSIKIFISKLYSFMIDWLSYHILFEDSELIHFYINKKEKGNIEEIKKQKIIVDCSMHFYVLRLEQDINFLRKREDIMRMLYQYIIYDSMYAIINDLENIINEIKSSLSFKIDILKKDLVDVFQQVIEVHKKETSEIKERIVVQKDFISDITSYLHKKEDNDNKQFEDIGSLKSSMVYIIKAIDDIKEEKKQQVEKEKWVFTKKQSIIVIVLSVLSLLFSLIFSLLKG